MGKESLLLDTIFWTSIRLLPLSEMSVRKPFSKEEEACLIFDRWLFQKKTPNVLRSDWFLNGFPKTSNFWVKQHFSISFSNIQVILFVRDFFPGSKEPMGEGRGDGFWIVEFSKKTPNVLRSAWFRNNFPANTSCWIKSPEFDHECWKIDKTFPRIILVFMVNASEWSNYWTRI